MKHDAFKTLALKVTERLLEAVAAQNLDDTFDVDNPVFFMAAVTEEDRHVLVLMNDPENCEGIEKLAIEPLVAFVKLCLKTLPLGVADPVAVCLSSGWDLDPKTRERRGEILTLTFEDKDRNVGLVKYTMERVEGEPVKLVDRCEWFEENCSYIHYGRMQNLFDLPPLEEKEAVN